MRTLTLARMGRALLLAAAVIMLPQLASAQLPMTTKSLILQDADAGQTITINPASSVTTSYSLTLPAAVGGAGAFLYASNATGTLAWTDMTSVVAGWYPTWDGTAVVWTDPAGANNPNWSLTGNNKASGTHTLGFTDVSSTADIAIKTQNATRIAIAAGGSISINNATDIDGGLTINDVGLTVTAGGATITDGGLTVTAGGATVTAGGATINGGGLTLGTASANPITLGTNPGAVGDVLISKGGAATPEWQSITEAIGIRNAGVVSFTAASKTATAISVADLASTDAIIVTVEQSGNGDAAVTATVTNRTAAAGAGQNGTFHITLSGVYTGSANYMVIKQK